MNILLDFIPLQHNGGVGGAASFAKTVCEEVVANKSADVRLFAAYDAKLPAGRLYDHKALASQFSITLIDITRTPLRAIIEKHQIDVFFIAIGQFYAQYDLSGIRCKTVMFIHDIFEIERNDNKIDLALNGKYLGGFKAWAKRAINVFSNRRQRQAEKRYDSIMPLYAAENTIPYTVSNYTAQALHYYFPQIKKEIQICYSPSKNVTLHKEIECEQLKSIIRSGKRYLLLVAANRIYKNANVLLKVFARLSEEDLMLVTLNYGQSIHSKHIDIPFLSDSDLEHAYSHAFALVFASFFEGFGYPPIEAMRHGTPVIASNVTSIPEVAGDAALYFSPFYPADLYRAIKQLLTRPAMLDDKMQERTQYIAAQQKLGMSQLLTHLFDKKI